MTGATIDGLRTLAERGFSFYGHHSAATEFNASAFFAVSGEFVAGIAADDGCPVIRVVVEPEGGAKMVDPEKALTFANQLARITVLIDGDWKRKKPPKKPTLTVVP